MCSQLQCVVLCFVKLVVDAIGDYIVEAYSSIGLVLYFAGSGVRCFVELSTKLFGLVQVWMMCG